MSILSQILATKREEIQEAKSTAPLSVIRQKIDDLPRPRDFLGAIRTGKPAVIAEIKRASPSKGILVQDFDHRKMARDFEEGGASALSVLTDRQFFHGHPQYIADVRDVSRLPVLRKDFVMDEYQIIESRALEADAVLLIVRILSDPLLKDLIDLSRTIGLAALVEIHNEEELSMAVEAGADLIGINNRDLADFSVSIDRSLSLRSKIRHGILTVSESGIQSPEDVKVLAEAGFHAVLIGESLAKSENRIQSLREMIRE